jgi:ribosome-associated protein
MTMLAFIFSSPVSCAQTLPVSHQAALCEPATGKQYNLLMTIGAEIELAPGVRVPAAAVSYSFISSSGPGGQNVNKRATKCVLRVALAALPLTEAQVARLRDIAGHLITDSGDVLIAAGEHRSQGQNEEECRERLREILIVARRPVRKRVKTKPTRGSKERRISEKKRRGEIKKGRRGED